MKTLTIRQPWAWLIIHGGKDIENRTWHTKFRGRFLVHAAQGMTAHEYESAREFARICAPNIILPAAKDLLRGGIIGSVELVSSVDNSKSPWYMGEKGFVLRSPRRMPFHRCKGQLQFWDLPGGDLLPGAL